MNLTISSNNHADVQKNDDERISSHPARLPVPKTSFLIALVIIALVCLVSSCTEQDVEIIEPPKPQPITLPESIYVFNIYFSDIQTGWLSVMIMGHGNKYKGGLFKTTDGGLNWFASLLNEKSSINAVYFLDSQKGLCTGGEGQLFTTSNGGTTWEEYDTKKFLGSEYSLYYFARLYFRNSNEGWMTGSKDGSPIDCGGYGYLFHTTNGGNDWLVDYSTTYAALTDICMLQDGNGWITGGGHRVDCSPFILHTTDNGTTWMFQDVGPDINGLVSQVAFFNNTYGFVYGYSGILRTTNGGEKWDTTGYGMGYALELVLLNDSVVFVSRTSPSTIYKSIDKGKNWNVSLRVPELLHSIYFLNDSTGWAAGIVTYPAHLAVYRYNSNVWTKIR